MSLSKQDFIHRLSATKDEEQMLFQESERVKLHHVGNKVYLRGLIEFSNICQKDCFYCGIRQSNSKTHRYCITEEEVLEAARFAHQAGFGSLAIQSGELTSKAFTDSINQMLRKIIQATNGDLGITLSCGEQSEEVYRQWFESGAKRYLLRIETSSEELYKKLHPQNSLHGYARRLGALQSLKKTGYHVGTGVMMGLPFQTVETLADDLLFMKELDIDMCGMGPYIEHAETPLYHYKDTLKPLAERLDLSFRMVALLRILMPDINIAATTAMQAIEKNGREKALRIGANVLMPNITPKHYRDDYFLYQNKPVSKQNDEDDLKYLEKQLKDIGLEVGYFEQGNSKHYKADNDKSFGAQSSLTPTEE